MTAIINQGVMMENWHKCPNAIIDGLMGETISPSAGIILMTIIRYTLGMQNRTWAKIPHTVFMQKTATKRKETIGKYIKELENLQLIKTDKGNGKTTAYAVNWNCELWFKCEETSTLEPYRFNQSVPVRLNRTSTLETETPVRLNRTALHKTSTDEAYPYKDNNKDNIIKTSIHAQENSDVVFSDDEISDFEKSHLDKNLADWKNPDQQEILSPQENLNHALEKNSLPKSANVPPKATKANKPDTVEKPAEVSDQTWKDFLTVRKSHKAPLTLTAWNIALGEITKTQEKTGHSLEQIMTVWVAKGWRGFKADWYLNHINQSGNQFYAPANDRLAVNKNWQPQNDGIIRTATATIEEMF